MYAAAGGASLASRQARQRQRQKKASQSQPIKELKPHQAKQYHNYTDNEAPVALQAQPPKLSKVERGALKPPTPHERRHSASNYHLNANVRGRMRESPSISIPVQAHHHHQHQQHAPPLDNHVLSSPTLPQILIPEGEGKLERRCSFVRQVEEMEQGGTEGGGSVLDRCNHMCNFEIKEGVKGWGEASFVDYERDVFGSCSDYPFSECSQGRAAWQERERGRRCSLSDEARQHRVKQTEAHHRWMKRNRIHDSTYGAGSDDDDFFNVYHQSAAANALLYVGLGTTAIGSVIFFVGTGEKGFKTLELRLIGPTLVACGLLCCLIRVLLCACPSTCLRRRTKKPPRLKPDPRAPLLAPPPRPKKKVSIVPPQQPGPSGPPAIELPEIRLPEPPTVLEMDESCFDLVYDIRSVSEMSDSGGEGGEEPVTLVEVGTKLTRAREPLNKDETCLTVVVERSASETSEHSAKHSGIVLSPLQLGRNN